MMVPGTSCPDGRFSQPSTCCQRGLPWSGVLLFLIIISHSAVAQWSVTAYLGKASTLESDLEIIQPSVGTEMTFHGLSFNDESFKPPVYYGIRIGYFFEKPRFFGLEAEFIHLKASADPEALVRARGMWEGMSTNQTVRFGDFVESFSITHGLNLLTLNIAFRHGLLVESRNSPKLYVTARIGAGPAIPHTESRINGILQEQYEFAGRVIQFGLSSELQVFSMLHLLLEYKYTVASFSRLHIVNGSARISPRTHHFIFGLSGRL